MFMAGLGFLSPGRTGRSILRFLGRLGLLAADHAVETADPQNAERQHKQGFSHGRTSWAGDQGLFIESEPFKYQNSGRKTNPSGRD